LIRSASRLHHQCGDHRLLLVAQVSLMADELLKHKADVTRVVFNQFKSAISFQPTVSTVMSAEVGSLPPLPSLCALAP